MQQTAITLLRLTITEHNDMDHPTPAFEPSEVDVLRAEIRHFEVHLEQIGGDDDSAYGKARIRMYEALLQERRHRLSALTALHQGQIASQDYL